jgi:hypothetical protein
MARKKRTPTPSEGGTNKPASAQPESERANGESVAGYFRKVFRQKPKLLKVRGNEEVLKRWLADHPGHAEVPKSVQASLSNIKSLLRNARKRGKAQGAEAGAADSAAPATPARLAPRDLDRLEQHIDECLALAKGLGREELQEVIQQLRRARNEVIWKTAT